MIRAVKHTSIQGQSWVVVLNKDGTRSILYFNIYNNSQKSSSSLDSIKMNLIKQHTKKRSQ